MFKQGQKVKHNYKGGWYRITKTPDARLLESNGESFYEYESIVSGQVWVRCKSEMEDGRFISEEKRQQEINEWRKEEAESGNI